MRSYLKNNSTICYVNLDFDNFLSWKVYPTSNNVLGT